MEKQKSKPRYLNPIAKQIHENAVNHGFWDSAISPDHFLMLVVSELSEAIEADRNGKYFRSDFKVIIDRCTKELYEERFKTHVKDTVGDELADSVIRLLDLAEAYRVDLDNTSALYCLIHDEDSFCGNVWQVVKMLASPDVSLDVRIASGINAIELLAKDYGIDLWWHIEKKMLYNAGRPYLHAKKY